jgi:hypothetical protein
MSILDNPTPNWAAKWESDLDNSTPIQFTREYTAFREWCKTQPRKAIHLVTGWNTLEGEDLEQLLIRNVRNRPLSFRAVLALYHALLNGQFKKTGETMILNERGDMEDAAHRAVAAYLAKKPLPIFVVTDVPYEPNLFAYIDSGLSRTGGDALGTAGLNGLSKHIASVIKDIALRYDEGSLTYGRGRMPTSPITNIDILNYANANPGLAQAAHTVQDSYAPAARRLADSKVATFFAWKVSEMHGEDAVDAFFTDLTAEGLAGNHPVMVLRRRLDEHEAAKAAPTRSPRRKGHLTQPQILALAIKAFNMTQLGTSARRLDPRADDPFPRFEDIEASVSDASETPDVVLAPAPEPTAIAPASDEAMATPA